MCLLLVDCIFRGGWGGGFEVNTHILHGHPPRLGGPQLLPQKALPRLGEGLKSPKPTSAYLHHPDHPNHPVLLLLLSKYLKINNIYKKATAFFDVSSGVVEKIATTPTTPRPAPRCSRTTPILRIIACRRQFIQADDGSGPLPPPGTAREPCKLLNSPSTRMDPEPDPCQFFRAIFLAVIKAVRVFRGRFSAA